MGDAAGAYLYRPEEGELRWMGETSTCFLATGEQTGGAFCLVDEQASRGESVPLHRHRDDMESFYVLEGEITLYLDDRPGARAPAGSFAQMPGGTVHGFRVESPKARYLILTTPRHGEFYRAITLASRPRGLPPLDPVQGPQIKQRARSMGSSSSDHCRIQSTSDRSREPSGAFQGQYGVHRVVGAPFECRGGQ
jgi:quercetin dioxygenase-like cupin family protein